MNQEKRRKRLRWMRPIMIVAVLAGLFMLYQKIHYARRDFYQEFYTPYPSDVTLSLHDPEAENAIDHYNSGHYLEAEKEFDQLVSESDMGIASSLYRGICKMENNDYWGAIDDFEVVKKSGSDLVQQAEWYKALCFLALQRKKDLTALLEYYVEQPDFQFKKEEAERLLREY